jgi:hypothetical protein
MGGANFGKVRFGDFKSVFCVVEFKPLLVLGLRIGGGFRQGFNNCGANLDEVGDVGATLLEGGNSDVDDVDFSSGTVVVTVVVVLVVDDKLGGCAARFDSVERESFGGDIVFFNGSASFGTGGGWLTTVFCANSCGFGCVVF